jgi:hypothetical protein
MFASSVQIASDPVGVRLADVDEDGRLDIVTTIERRAIAVTGRDRVFETRDLHLPLPSDTLDFALDPGDGSKPARLFVSQRICGP